MKRLLTILLAAALLLAMFPLGVSASIENNQSSQQYSWFWSSPIQSYLVANGTGYMTVGPTADESKLLIKYFDSSFNRTSYKYIDSELPLFGGFYAGQNAYYVVYGQENPGESNSAEVIRVVKYSKDWVRQSAASVRGANTTIPFEAGSLRMAEEGAYLYIHTCHQMYKSNDGLNHQANMLLQIRTSDMFVEDSHYLVWSDYSYVSHSFNQFILVDDSQNVVQLDHGDAYPRSAVLARYCHEAGKDFSAAGTDRISVLSFYGEIGDNDTGANLGGLEFSDSHYLVAGSSVKQDGSDSDTYNIFVGVTSRSNFSEEGTALHWITSYPEGGELSASTPQLVKMNSNLFLLMWEIGEGKISYVFLDGAGNPTGAVQSKAGYLSDCKPIVQGGKAIWFVTDGVSTTFYTLSTNGTLTSQLKDYAKLEVGGDFGKENALHWKLSMDGSTLTISGKGDIETDGTTPWLFYSDHITKVVIQKGITGIIDTTFAGYSYLTSITLPDSLESIGEYAFAN